MSIFQRVVLLIKVLVLMSLGMSAAWAHNPVQSGQAGFSASHDNGLLLAKSEAQGEDKEDDDSTSKEPDTDDPDGDEGDSQT